MFQKYVLENATAYLHGFADHVPFMVIIYSSSNVQQDKVTKQKLP